MRKTQVATAAGQMPVQHFPSSDSAPLVVILMDAIGIREELRDVARLVQREGYNVALPNLYYREGPVENLDMNAPDDRETIMRLYKGYSHQMALQDITALLDQFTHRPVGLLGYCMGGAKALVVAGSLPDKIAAAAAIHPGGIATGAEDSPHRLAPLSSGELYLAIADEDPYATPEQVQQLTTALDEADSQYTLEHYSGAHHGFAFASLPTYNAEAQHRYQQATLALFNRTLKPHKG